MSDLIIIKAKIKEFTGDYNVSGDFIPALNKKVMDMVKEAVERAKSNSRKTVMAKDI